MTNGLRASLASASPTEPGTAPAPLPGDTAETGAGRPATEPGRSRRPRTLIAIGSALLVLSAVWHLAVAPRFARRIGPDWRWTATFIGTQRVPDAETGRWQDGTSSTVYEREVRAVRASEPGRAVEVEDRYTTLDPMTGKTTWEYILRTGIDPLTGRHLAPEFRDDHAVFPRNVQRARHTLRANYLKGVPVDFEGEETIEGLRTYRFGYHGPAEYTESYAGTEHYPGVPVQPGQEIRCADDGYSLRLWVEPATGEMVAVEESCYPGDYVYDTATGTALAPVMQWGGTTAGDDVLLRVERLRGERLRYLLATRYVPAALLGGGVFVLLAGVVARRRAAAVRRLPPLPAVSAGRGLG